MFRHHSDKTYEHDLRELHESLLRMAGRVEEMIGLSVKALLERDGNLAERTIEADYRVNQCEVDTDELCLIILATRQPKAGDLRFITIALKMVTDLERIGDLAVNICERVERLKDAPSFRVYDDIPEMARNVQAMVGDAIKAFVSSDVEAATAIIERDDEVDGLYHKINRELISVMTQSAAMVEPGIHVQSVVKFLERIADHATNLAELVVFMVKGKDIRHLGKRQSPSRPASN